MPSRTPLLLTGATGYVGGMILTRFLRRPDASSFDIRLLVRSTEKADKIHSLNLGFDVIIGSYADAKLMEDLASNVDVVIAAADSDNVMAAQSILKGLKKRYENTGRRPILIHTSGTGLYAELVDGKRADSQIFDDANPEQIERLSPTAFHRPVDSIIAAADAEGYVQSYIVIPSTVWGIATGPLFEAGISHRHSIQIPLTAKVALARGQGGMVNEGRNVWPLVEIHELGDLYSILYDAIQRKHSMAGHGREGYYNAAYEEYSTEQLSRRISEVLVALGKVKSSHPSSYTNEELEKYFGIYAPYFGSSCHCLATRSKAIGWNPKKGLDEMLASVQSEVEAAISNNI